MASPDSGAEARQREREKQRAVATERSDREQGEKAAEASRARQEALRLACLPRGFLVARWPYFFIVAFVLAVFFGSFWGHTMVSLATDHHHHVSSGDRMDLVLWCCAFGLVVGLGTLGFALQGRWRRAADRAVADERRWLDGLPFRVADYYGFFSSSSCFKYIRLDLALRDSPDDRARPELVAKLAPIARSFSPDAAVGQGTFSGLSVYLAPLANERSGPGARLLFHDAVDKVLLPIHAEVPLDRLTFSSSDSVD
jgi:hypothetical protein